MSEDPRPPAAITSKVFKEWRSPRFGSANPERMDNPLWKWLIECRLNAYQANEALKGPSPFDAGPMWCFDRFGQSTTELADGRTVLIAGEHEDGYDPDFYIYNDLVVKRPDGGTEIYCYPRAAFQPTDFHSATLVGNRIVLIGNLGYDEERRVGQTQVLTVDCDTWSVSRIDSRGPFPGWIHRHRAELQPDGGAIVVSGGKLWRGMGLSLVENIDDWKLQLDAWRWERLTERRWIRFEVYREDRTRNHLFDLRTVLWEKERRWEGWEARERQLQSELGAPPRLDLLAALYRSSVPHEPVPENEDEYGVHRVRVEGVVVRYVDDGWTIQVSVEGDLKAPVVEQLRRDLTGTLEALEHAPIVSRPILTAV